MGDRGQELLLGVWGSCGFGASDKDGALFVCPDHELCEGRLCSRLGLIRGSKKHLTKLCRDEG